MMHRAVLLLASGGEGALLRCASLLVPAPGRAEWHQEWCSELWHVRLACMPADGFTWEAEREVVAFCLGAFNDAACLRRLGWQAAAEAVAVHGSAAQCVLWLATTMVLSAIVAGFIPGILSEEDAAKNPSPKGVILIQRASSASPSISAGEYRGWKAHRQRFFSDMAFYWPERTAIAIAGSSRDNWVVAHASRNLFQLMGVEFAPGTTAALPHSRYPQAVLSQWSWRRDFQSDPGVIGRIVTVGGRMVEIAGIAAMGSWRLPGEPDLWLLESDGKIARTQSGYDGFVVARLSPEGKEQMGASFISITAASADGEAFELRGFPVDSEASGPVPVFLFALFLAVLGLPAITSVAKSESNFASHRPSFRTRLKRWSFLAAKIALIGLIAYFASLDMAYWAFPRFSPSAEFLQFIAAFVISLFGLRWAVNDQSKRCPVCLRRVTHPAQVGFASCNFLGWNGTEMICTGGHALLHVPSLPTSWFSGQRWTYLDTSWDFLFADSRVP